MISYIKSLINNNRFEQETNKMSRQALQVTLDAVASKDNKIDNVFIFLPNTGSITMHSEVSGFSGQPTVDSFRQWIGRLGEIENALSHTGYGDLHYATFPMKDAIITLFFLNEGFTETIVVGFVCEQNGNAEKALGEHVYNAKKFMLGYKDNRGKPIDGIKDMLQEIY
jgi:hypothetical protein